MKITNTAREHNPVISQPSFGMGANWFPQRVGPTLDQCFMGEKEGDIQYDEWWDESNSDLDMNVRVTSIRQLEGLVPGKIPCKFHPCSSALDRKRNYADVDTVVHLRIWLRPTD